MNGTQSFSVSLLNGYNVEYRSLDEIRSLYEASEVDHVTAYLSLDDVRILTPKQVFKPIERSGGLIYGAHRTA